jgi:hypothetical protein
MYIEEHKLNGFVKKKLVDLLELSSVCLLASGARTFVKPKESLPRVAVQVKVDSDELLIWFGS